MQRSTVVLAVGWNLGMAKPRSGAGNHDDVPGIGIFLLSGDRPTAGDVAV
jgi:hypothetical protein